MFGKKITYHRIFPNTVASDGKLGGICLDFYDKIPEPYKSLLHIGKNVMIKTGSILCGEGFHFERDALSALKNTISRQLTTRHALERKLAEYEKS